MKIAIIGSGGAGLTTAWLLEEEHDVVVYERNPTMGGHAHTVEVERDGHRHTVDDGFCWFSESMYPRYLALLKTLGVATDAVDMTASFTDVQRGKSVFMPPVGLGPVMGVVFSPFALGNLLRFAGAVKAAETIVRDHITDITCEDFLAGLSQSKRFQDEFLLPFMSAVWGCPWEQTLRSSIYPLMKYIVLHRPTAFSYYTWQVIHGGTAAYIRSLATHLEHAVVYPDTPVQSVQKTDTGFRVRSRGILTRSSWPPARATRARSSATPKASRRPKRPWPNLNITKPTWPPIATPPTCRPNAATGRWAIYVTRARAPT